MTCNDIYYHLYPLGFLGAEDRNPHLHSDDGSVTHRLADLHRWLDYFVELGVTSLLLGPVFESETHGYDLVDPFRVDRRLGDESDLVAFIDACHQRGLKVALDMVFNHVGRGHPYFQDVLQHGRDSKRCSWFHLDFDQPGYDGFSYENFEGIGQLVKLNHANAEVLDWAVRVAGYWMDRGVDAFRLDAAYAIPGRFLAEFSDQVRAERSDLLLIGEVIHGDYVSIVESSGLGAATQYELWKAIWSALNDRNFFELAHALERHSDFCEHFLPWTFVGNHDTTRIATRLSDSRHLPQAVALLFVIPGLPAVYAGDELGVKGTKYEREGGDDEIRRPLPIDPEDRDAGKPLAWQHHRQLIEMRRSRPWLQRGSLRVTQLANRTITLEVRGDQDVLVAAFNTDDQSASCEVAGDKKLIAGQTVSPTTTELPPHGWAIWSSN
ncbi:alpha-amylase [Roseiconus nitratireducens]|uniref:Alpha-amylase n=1 Tax=Roseiconus nitratireducens TaxID=2605748 RepID=A0A5M6D2U1_9BACT|nr:alpha-amylase family glycosyl hydrolase [Roseiconus nitratireducens]KAA5541316.1 alpha-amylase [Roseiconus nitratireducens]